MNYRHNNKNPTPVKIYFDPSTPDAQLFDTDAEEQAKVFDGKLTSTQLRRFFTEIKGLYTRHTSLTKAKPEGKDDLYRTEIEPLFKMVRSKAMYASRPGKNSQLPKDFCTFLTESINKVQSENDFCRFVMHFEAVVGFMYGHGKVKK